MLRVGLTGGLASGKSTVAGLFRAHGAELIEADRLGHQLMEPGQPVFDAILRHFGRGLLDSAGRLDRSALARLAFAEGRLQELNAIVHPAVIEAQQRWMDALFLEKPQAIAVVESALIFEVVRDARRRGETSGILADWRRRLDRVVLVTAPVELRIARYVERTLPASALPAERELAAAEARRRLAHQIPDQEKAALADDLLENTGDLDSLRLQVKRLWLRLQAANNSLRASLSLQ